MSGAPGGTKKRIRPAVKVQTQGDNTVSPLVLQSQLANRPPDKYPVRKLPHPLQLSDAEREVARFSRRLTDFFRFSGYHITQRRRNIERYSDIYRTEEGSAQLFAELPGLEKVMSEHMPPELLVEKGSRLKKRKKPGKAFVTDDAGDDDGDDAKQLDNEDLLQPKQKRAKRSAIADSKDEEDEDTESGVNGKKKANGKSRKAEGDAKGDENNDDLENESEDEDEDGEGDAAAEDDFDEELDGGDYGETYEDLDDDYGGDDEGPAFGRDEGGVI